MATTPTAAITAISNAVWISVLGVMLPFLSSKSLINEAYPNWVNGSLLDEVGVQ
jgi:ABC-type uncharacterized transport system permease subunit